MTLIGFSCKYRKVLRREVLIDRFFRTFVFSPLREERRGEEDIEGRNNLLFLFDLFLDFVLWWFNGGVTPVLIPNTEVKLASGDGSRGYTRPE